MSKAFVVPDDELAKMTLNVLRSRFEKEERSGTHVSDLIFPRKTWIAKRVPKTLTDEECLFFIAGRAHHEIVESLIAEKQLREVKMEWNGIVGTVDAIGNGSGHPVEFKSTRAMTPYGSESIPGHYLLQLGMYVAMLNPGIKEGEGTLLILYLSQKTGGVFGRRRNTPKLSSFKVRFDDLEQIRGLMLERKSLVEGEVAPPMELCDAWLCRSCRFLGAECEGRRE